MAVSGSAHCGRGELSTSVLFEMNSVIVRPETGSDAMVTEELRPELAEAMYEYG